MEIWRPVVGYEGIYEVSNFGRIKALENIRKSRWGCYRKAKEFIRKPRFDKDGYLTIGLTKNRKQQQFKVHQIVAKAFIPNPYNKKAINHKNSIRYDNQVENIEWCTNKENTIHMILYGKGIKYGVKHPGSKLSPSKVRKIRKLYENGETYLSISKKYSLNPDSIRSVVKRLTWKEVK